jgi:threonine/homoserine/homoserine lactone efflux protein
MWMAVAFIFIALAGTAFLTWFTLGLLRENRPSTSFRVVTLRREPERKIPGALSGLGNDPTMGYVQSAYSVKLLENEGYAKKYTSGLIALDIRPVSASLGWRSIRAKHVYAFRGHRL